MKQLRDDQGYSCTSPALTIYKQTTDEEADKAAMLQEMRDELKETKQAYDLHQKQQQVKYCATFRIKHRKMEKGQEREKQRRESAAFIAQVLIGHVPLTCLFHSATTKKK